MAIPEATQPDPADQRSDFVTVLAWIFIALSGFATMISALQNLMVWLVFPLDRMRELQAEAAAQGMPAIPAALFGHIELWFGGVLAVSAVTLAAAIGLLRRKNWARLLFIAILALMIAFNLVALPMQWMIFDGIPQVEHPELRGFGTMLLVMQIFSTILAAGFCVLFGWIIKRLLSPAIRREFGVA
jgi:hypothetical protein